VGGSFVYCLREAFEGIGGFSPKVYAGEDVIFSYGLRMWGRRNRKKFKLITQFPIESSDRKLRWHSSFFLLLTFALFTVFPFAVRFRPLCRLWYERPRK